MPVEREGARIRHRSIGIAADQQAEVWLEATTERVSLHTAHPNGGGSGNWARCTESACVGAAVIATKCLLHADAAARASYLAQPAGGPRALSLNGVVVPEQLWNEVLDGCTTEDRRITTTILWSGAVLPFKLRLSDLRFEGAFSLVGAVLEDGCDARDCRFAGGLGLDFVDFGDGPGFFDSCRVDRNLAAGYAHTDRQHVAFVKCDISCDIRAEGFAGDFRLESCNAQQDCGLRNSALSHFSLADTSIAGDLDISGVEARWVRATRLELRGATTVGPMRVESACDLSGARFSPRLQLDLAAEHLDLRGATWIAGGRLEIERATVDLERLVAAAPVAVVGRGAASVVSLRSADANGLTFADIDMSRCVFYGARGLQQTTLEQSVRLADAPKPFRSKRRCVADEFAWRAQSGTWRRSDWNLPGTSATSPEPDRESKDTLLLPALTAAQVAGVYRSLRKSLEEQSNEPGAADFYYGEMEMRRKDRTSSRSERLIIYMYWIASGYGLRAARGIALLSAVVIASSLLLLRFGFPAADAGFDDSLIISLQSAVPGVNPDMPLTNWGRVLDLSLTVMAPVLLALVVLALRNRVRR